MNRKHLIFSIILVIFSNVLYADCKSDLANLDVLKQKGLAAAKAGKYSLAQSIYKKGARKTSGLKFKCQTLSLPDLTKRERFFRTAARTVSCGAYLDKGNELAAKAKAVARSKPHVASGLYKNAIAQYERAKTACPGTSVSRKADQMIASIHKSAKPVAMKGKMSKRKAGSKAVSSPGPMATVSDIKVNLSKKRNRKNKCFKEKLAHVVSIENSGMKAFKAGHIERAANHLSIAADMYDKDSVRCKSVSERLGVIDRSRYLKKQVSLINHKYNRCAKSISSAEKIARQAEKDEQAGDFQFAQESYVKAALLFDRIPKGCASPKHLGDKERYRMRAQLLSCKHYIDGIKEYNQAFREISQANRKKASEYYSRAVRYFDAALTGCHYTGTNVKVIMKLKNYSVKSISRLSSSQ